LGLRLHDLRHAAVALWIAAGAGPKQVATSAGHEAHQYHDLETQTLALDGLARAAAAQGDIARAAQLLREADGLHTQVQHTLDDADRLDAQAVRAALGT
jgi:hypothetical protein